MHVGFKELEEAKIEMELLREERAAPQGNKYSDVSPLVGTSPSGSFWFQTLFNLCKSEALSS